MGFWKIWARKRGSASRPVPQQRIPLHLTELESRCTPAQFLWKPLNLPYPVSGAEQWSHVNFSDGKTNWLTRPDDSERWSRLTANPAVGINMGPGAEVFFDARVSDGNSNCVVDVPVTVHSLTIAHAYTESIHLGQSLIVSNSFTFDAPGAIIGGTLILDKTCTGTWTNGWFQDVTVEVRSGQGQSATLNVEDGGEESYRTTNAATFEVQGRLNWKGGDVGVVGAPGKVSRLNVKPGGTFTIDAHAMWGADPALLSIRNEGTVHARLPQPTSTTILGANYTTTGLTSLERGLLSILGTAEQNTPSSGESRFELLNGSWITTNYLRIQDGYLAGNGTVNGHLVMGRDGALPGYVLNVPTIAPGGEGAIGTIHVINDFQMFNGRMAIDIAGPPPAVNTDPHPYDRIVVGGAMKLTNLTPGGAPNPDSVRRLQGYVNARELIPANREFSFLIYGSREGDYFLKAGEPGQAVEVPTTGTWSFGRTEGAAPKRSWFNNTTEIAKKDGKAAGIVWRDDGAVAGKFEATEDGVAGVTVRLFDATGTTQLDSTTTDANGAYAFPDLDPGVYVVAFDRPTGERFAVQDAFADDLDSDPDPLTGRVTVPVYDDVEDVSAGLYYDAAPVAVDDAALAHKNTATVGSVGGNDTDADGDALTYAVATGPSHGSLTLNPDGTFTYTPATDYTGTDTFTYTAADGYGGTDTGSVTITVANTPAPVGTSDSYSTGGAFAVEAADGVLDNDTDQNNGTLTAVLATGPSHGTVELFADGSFVYTPDDDFVGTDTFTYRPTDADGPGNLTTVSVAVTDHPPEAADDTATTDEDEAVAIAVLTNDTDPDAGDTLTVVGASDGVYGTTTVNANGTITYTPGADFSGTDWFVYVIDDGYGRLSFATVTVTVDPVNDAPVAADDARTILRDTGTTIAVLANDTDADGDALTITGVTQGAHGMVMYSATGVTYTPDFGYTGTDTFTYTISDGHGGTDTATVTVTVVAPATISGSIWADTDADGIQDVGESMYMSGVTVYLYDADDNLVTSVPVTGMYWVANVLPGQYKVRVSIPSGTTVSAKDQGSDDAVDCDFDASGYTSVFTVAAGASYDFDIGLH